MDWRWSQMAARNWGRSGFSISFKGFRVLHSLVHLHHSFLIQLLDYSYFPSPYSFKTKLSWLVTPALSHWVLSSDSCLSANYLSFFAESWFKFWKQSMWIGTIHFYVRPEVIGFWPASSSGNWLKEQDSRENSSGFQRQSSYRWCQHSGQSELVFHLYFLGRKYLTGIIPGTVLFLRL